MMASHRARYPRGAFGSSVPIFTHGGHPWSFWRKSGQFLYVFGEAYGDDNAPPPDEETPVKIGITSDPKNRLASLRQKTPYGVWYDIQWMQNAADVTERSLHELFNPWRCGFEREWFCLPYEVEQWLMEGMADSWSRIAKQQRISGENLRSMITETIPLYYPAEWLKKRIENLNSL